MTTPDEERAHWDARSTMFEMWADQDDGVDHCLERIVPEFALLNDRTATLLEYGCGIGRLTRPMARALPTVEIIGVDISRAGILIARQDTTEKNVRYRQSDGRSLSDVATGIDGGWSVVTLQHIPALAQVDLLEEIRDLLRPGGCFVAQVTVGGDDADWSHPLSDKVIRALNPASVATDDRFPTWRWLYLR